MHVIRELIDGCRFKTLYLDEVVSEMGPLLDKYQPRKLELDRQSPQVINAVLSAFHDRFDGVYFHGGHGQWTHDLCGSVTPYISTPTACFCTPKMAIKVSYDFITLWYAMS